MIVYDGQRVCFVFFIKNTLHSSLQDAVAVLTSFGLLLLTAKSFRFEWPIENQFAMALCCVLSLFPETFN